MADESVDVRFLRHGQDGMPLAQIVLRVDGMDHQHDHGSHGHSGHDRDHGHDHGSGSEDASVADILDLDAEVLGAYLDELTAWTAGHVAPAPAPRTIVDIGAGTGTGTLALARRFAAAELIAIDRSPTMLERLRAAAASRGIAGRLRTVQADLDAAWPQEAGAADLAWASSSLHHLADPDRVLADVHAALNPGGLLVVVEMDAHAALPARGRPSGAGGALPRSRRAQRLERLAELDRPSGAGRLRGGRGTHLRHRDPPRPARLPTASRTAS